MSADLSTSRFAVPDRVLQSQRARERARNQHVQCAGDGGRCRRPAKHSCSRWGGAYCDTCWAELPRTTATPDPARTLDGLRAAAGLPLNVAPGYRTVSDTRAEAKGQRVSAARRAAARGDLPREPDPVRHQVLDVISQLVERGQPFSANDARPLLPPGTPGLVMGACWSAAVKQHGLVEVGRVPSTDPSTNSHRIPVWSRA